MPPLGDAEVLAPHIEDPAGHVGRLGTGQPRRYHRDPARVDAVLELVGRVVAAHQRGGEARPGRGGQAVDGHAVADQLLGCDHREGGDAGLGRAVVGLADVAVDPRR